MSSSQHHRIADVALRTFIAEAFRECGLPEQDAGTVARLMTEADLTGADAHGIFRLPQYVRRLKAGGVNQKPEITVRRTAAATALVEGDNGMGHLVMARAAETAVALARESGVAWVGARRSNHAGPAGLYAAIPAEAGLVGIYSAVASANHMAPWGGAETLLGTNPLAVAIPQAGGPLVLDIATTVVSYGTVKNYALQGRTMPDGWMVDPSSGASVTDPSQREGAILLPIGGYKGSGLALVLGLLAGTLNGAAFGRDVVDFNADASSETNTGHFILALDVTRFMPAEAFQAEVDRQLDELRRSQPLPGHGPVRLPGEERARRRAERAKTGVPIPAELRRDLDRLAAELGIAKLPGQEAA